MSLLGVIGGSGLAEFSELEIIEEKQLLTPYGMPSSTIIIAKLEKRKLVFLARHGRPHAIPPHQINYRANLWALKQLGVDEILAVNATGGISAKQEAGVISLPDQIIDYTYGREHTYSDSAEVSLQHIDFSYPYSQNMRNRLEVAAKKIPMAIITSGVYAATQGPRLETAAEIRRMINDGCDVVGMTGMPEASLARELGIEFACISLVVNKAAGLSEGLITMAEIEKVMLTGIQDVKALIGAYCSL